MFIFLPFILTADEPMPIEPAKLEVRTIDYSKEIEPLFQKKCLACHGGPEPKGGYSMENAEKLFAGAKKHGKGIVPGKPLESSVYLLASHAKKPVMPPRSENDELTPNDVAILKLWIEQGAKRPAVEARKTRAVVLSLPPALVKPVRALAIHGGMLAIARANQVRLVDAKTGDAIAMLTDPELKTTDGKPANAAHISLVESLAISPDGKRLATGSFREATIWDLEKKTIVARIGGLADKAAAIAWHPNGSLLAISGGAPTEDGEVKLFDAGGKLVRELKSPHSDTVYGIAFSPDGAMFATAGADRFVKVFETATGKLLKSFEGHTLHVLDVAWSPDGKKLASAGADDLIKIWDYEKGEKTRDLKNSRLQVQRLSFVGKTPNFLTVAGDGVVRRWSIDTGDPSRTFDGAKDALYAVAANADGSLVAAGGEEGLVRIYDGKTSQLLKTLEFKGK